MEGKPGKEKKPLPVSGGTMSQDSPGPEEVAKASCQVNFWHQMLERIHHSTLGQKVCWCLARDRYTCPVPSLPTDMSIFALALPTPGHNNVHHLVSAPDEWEGVHVCGLLCAMCPAGIRPRGLVCPASKLLYQDGLGLDYHLPGLVQRDISPS